MRAQKNLGIAPHDRSLPDTGIYFNINVLQFILAVSF